MPKTAPAMAGSQPIATDITAPLILDFLEWLAGPSGKTPSTAAMWCEGGTVGWRPSSR